MARATKATAAKAAPEPEPDEDDEFPLEYLLDKEPSQVHLNFCEYIKEQTGEDVADPKTVQLVISQYQKFQKSPEQQKFNADRKAASAAKAEAAETARAARESAAPAEKPTRSRSAAKSAATAPEEAPTRPARARRGAVTPPPAKRASGRRRPAPAVAEDID